ncbi:methionine/alanine import family NSS transporter small subunit [Tessaracoccus sp. Z1128]
MTTTALIMMIVAMLTLWGGLAASLVHLLRSPEVVVDEGDD